MVGTVGTLGTGGRGGERGVTTLGVLAIEGYGEVATSGTLGTRVVAVSRRSERGMVVGAVEATGGGCSSPASYG